MTQSVQRWRLQSQVQGHCSHQWLFLRESQKATSQIQNSATTQQLTGTAARRMPGWWSHGLRMYWNRTLLTRVGRLVANSMFHHVAHQEPNATANDAIRHPIANDRSLLTTLNQNLHLPKAHDHILLQHRAANCMLLTGAAVVVHQCTDNLNDNAWRLSHHSSLMRTNVIDHRWWIFW